MKNSRFKLTHSSQKHLSFGGFPLIQKQLANSEIPDLLNDMLPTPAPQAQYENADIILNMLYSVLMGGERLESVNQMAHELQQIKGFNAVSSDTVARRLTQWAIKDTQKFDGRDGRIHTTFNYAPALNSLLKKTAALSLPDKRGGYRLDVDAHIMENDKPDARTAYNHKRAYAPLVSFVGRHPVEVEMRSGNTAPSAENEEHVKRVVKELATNGIRIKELCSDAAGYNFKLIKWLNANRIRYYIRARKSESMRRHFGDLKNWHRVKNSEDKVLYEWSETTWKGQRLVVQRFAKKDRQYALLCGTPYHYQAIMTSDFRKKTTGRDIIEHYNHRGGSERNFDYLRNDFGWRVMPFPKMAQNTVYIIIMALIANIFEWIKLQVAKASKLITDTAIRVKNFILQFAAVPARWVKSGRNLILKLYTERDYKGLLVPI